MSDVEDAQAKAEAAVNAVDALRHAAICLVPEIRTDGDVLGHPLHNAAVVAMEIVKTAARGGNWRQVCGMRLVDNRVADYWIKRTREEAEGADSDGSD